MTLEELKTKEKRDQLSYAQARANIENISVKAPYYALKNERVVDEFIYAEFVGELNDLSEVGPITTAEIGRHMAILGSLVLSGANPCKAQHVYLATDAFINRVINVNLNHQVLQARVWLNEIGRKNGSIFGEVFLSDGTLIYEIQVKYSIIGYRLFERMFAKNKLEVTIPKEVNPYCSPIEFCQITSGSDEFTAIFGPVDPVGCVGHFNGYPALPVARMGSAMGKIAGSHFKYLFPNCEGKYVIANAELHATQLVFAGEEVFFKTRISNSDCNGGIEFTVTAFTQSGSMVAESILLFFWE